MGVILYIVLAGFPPFGENSFEQIKKGEYSFKDPRWSEVSTTAKDLISKLLTVNPQKRCNIEQIFEHPWMKSFKRVHGKTVEIQRGHTIVISQEKTKPKKTEEEPTLKRKISLESDQTKDEDDTPVRSKKTKSRSK